MCYGDCSFSRYTWEVLFSISCVIYHIFCNIATSLRESRRGFTIVAKANKLANFLQHSVSRDASIGRLSFDEIIVWWNYRSSRVLGRLSQLCNMWTNKDTWTHYVDDYETDLRLPRKLLPRCNYFACVAHRSLRFTPKKRWEREINWSENFLWRKESLSSFTSKKTVLNSMRYRDTRMR